MVSIRNFISHFIILRPGGSTARPGRAGRQGGRTPPGAQGGVRRAAQGCQGESRGRARRRPALPGRAAGRTAQETAAGRGKPRREEREPCPRNRARGPGNRRARPRCAAARKGRHGHAVWLLQGSLGPEKGQWFLFSNYGIIKCLLYNRNFCA